MEAVLPEEEISDKWRMYFMDEMFFLSPCKSTEGDTLALTQSHGLVSSFLHPPPDFWQKNLDWLSNIHVLHFVLYLKNNWNVIVSICMFVCIYFEESP